LTLEHGQRRFETFKAAELFSGSVSDDFDCRRTLGNKEIGILFDFWKPSEAPPGFIDSILLR
jgi:hypothetical protein